MKTYIAVAGNMGVGKTSMVEFMASHYGCEPVYEPYTTNPYLDDFYANMKGWGFHSQLWFLTHKFRLHLALNDRPGTVVQDRTIYEDAEIFAGNLARTGMMSSRDWQTYLDLYRSMRAALQPPDVMIYLRCSVRAIRRRIKRRGRPSEQQIPLAYIKGLNGMYEEWMEGYDLSPKLVWDSEDMDYMTDLVDQIEFRKMIDKFIR